MAVSVELFRVAVIVTEVVAVTVPAVAVKVADRFVPVTVTVAGTVRSVLLLATEITEPPTGDGWLRVSVQVVDCPDVKVVSAQVSAVNCGADTGNVTILLTKAF